MSEAWDQERDWLAKWIALDDTRKQIGGRPVAKIAAALARLDAVDKIAAGLREVEAENARLRNLCRQLEPARDERDQLLADHETIGQVLGCNHVADGLARCVRDVADQRDALLRFKLWVHAYLDAKGIPADPGGPHSAEGCRIGDRLDLVFARLDAAEKESADLRRCYESQKKCNDDMEQAMLTAEAKAARLVAAAEPVAVMFERVDKNKQMPRYGEWGAVLRRLCDEVHRIQPGGSQDAPPRTPARPDRPNLESRPTEDARRGNHDD